MKGRAKKKLNRIYVPVQNTEEIQKIKCGQEVLVCGKLFVARDAAHKRLFEMIRKGSKIPIDFNYKTLGGNTGNFIGTENEI